MTVTTIPLYTRLWCHMGRHLVVANLIQLDDGTHYLGQRQCHHVSGLSGDLLTLADALCDIAPIVPIEDKPQPRLFFGGKEMLPMSDGPYDIGIMRFGAP